MAEIKRWTPQADAWLRELYPDRGNRDIAHLLGRSYSAIKNRARVLGLTKSREYLEQEKPGRFRKGQTSWNKGLSYQPGGRTKEHQFKPGEKPANYKPLGSHRVSKDGYLLQKVTDTGYPPVDWKGVHIIRWESYHGRAVPAGHMVRFRDGDNRNFSRENLALVSRSENAVLNKFFAMKHPPEGGFDVLLNLARIKLASKKREKELAE